MCARRRYFDYHVQTKFGPVSVARILAEDVIQAAIKSSECGFSCPQWINDNRGFPDVNGVVRKENGVLHLEIIKGDLSHPDLSLNEIARVMDKGNFMAVVNDGYFYFIDPPPPSFEQELRDLLAPLLGNGYPEQVALIRQQKRDDVAASNMRSFALGFRSALKRPATLTLYPCPSGGGICLMSFSIGEPKIELSKRTTISKEVHQMMAPMAPDLGLEDLPYCKYNKDGSLGYFVDLAWGSNGGKRVNRWTRDRGIRFGQIMSGVAFHDGTGPQNGALTSSL